MEWYIKTSAFEQGTKVEFYILITTRKIGTSEILGEQDSFPRTNCASAMLETLSWM